MHKHLDRAIKNALAHNYDDFLEYQLCAVIARGGSIVSVGFNKRQTNSFVEHYTDRVRGSDRDYCMSTHAEMDAVAQVRSKTDLTGCKMYVARIRPVGNLAGENLGMARPCEICQKVLWAYGIRRAYYTINDNEYGVMKIIGDDDPDGDTKIWVGEEE